MDFLWECMVMGFMATFGALLWAVVLAFGICTLGLLFNLIIKPKPESKEQYLARRKRTWNDRAHEIADEDKVLYFDHDKKEK